MKPLSLPSLALLLALAPMTSGSAAAADDTTPPPHVPSSRVGGYGSHIPSTPAPVSQTTGAQSPYEQAPQVEQGVLPKSFDAWLKQTYMTGNWGGLRDRLVDHGVVFQGHYLEDSSGNPVGGRARAVRYAHEVGGGVDIDFKKLTGTDVGILHFLVTERAGLGLNAVLPALNSVQQIFGSGETVRLTRLSLEHNFGGYADVEAGWVNTENDFGQSTMHWGLSVYCQFQSNAICGMPQSLAMNSGYGYYPTAHPGAYLKLYPLRDDRILVSAGIYNVDSTISNTHNGWKMGLHDSTGAYLPFQLGWHHGGTDRRGALPGNIRVGGYWDSSEVLNTVAAHVGSFQPAGVALVDLPQDKVRGRFGGWVQFDQLLQRDGPGSNEGTMVFGAFTWGDPRTAEVPYFATWGIVRKGTFAGRPDDTISLGGKFAILNPKYAQYAAMLQQLGEPALRPSGEHSVELNYGWRPTAWVGIRPGLQYLWHPGGTNLYRNALILDFETALTF